MKKERRSQLRSNLKTFARIVHSFSLILFCNLFDNNYNNNYIL